MEIKTFYNMGNTHELAPRGNLNISGLDSEYYSGSVIKGIIELEALSDIETNKVKLVLTSSEYVKVFKSDILSNNYSQSKPIAYQISPIYNKDLEFIGRSRKFYKGKYRFPFSIDLPLRLPSSFEVKLQKSREIVFAGVAHILKASITRSNGALISNKVIKIKEMYVIDHKEGFGQLERLTNGKGFIARINKRRIIISDSIKTTLTYDNSSSHEKVRNFEWKCELNIKITTNAANYEHGMATSAGKIDGIDKLTIGEKEILIPMDIPDRNLQNAVTFKGKLIDISYLLKVYVVRPMLVVFNKREKLSFSLKLINYVPSNYILTRNGISTNQINLVTSDDMDKNKPPNRENSLPCKLDDKSIISICNNGENKHYTLNIPSKPNKGFDYPDYSEVNPLIAVSYNDLGSIRIYNLPINRDQKA